VSLPSLEKRKPNHWEKNFSKSQADLRMMSKTKAYMYRIRHKRSRAMCFLTPRANISFHYSLAKFLKPQTARSFALIAAFFFSSLSLPLHVSKKCMVLG